MAIMVSWTSFYVNKFRYYVPIVSEWIIESQILDFILHCFSLECCVVDDGVFFYYCCLFFKGSPMTFECSAGLDTHISSGPYRRLDLLLFQRTVFSFLFIIATVFLSDFIQFYFYFITTKEFDWKNAGILFMFTFFFFRIQKLSKLYSIFFFNVLRLLYTAKEIDWLIS